MPEHVVVVRCDIEAVAARTARPTRAKQLAYSVLDELSKSFDEAIRRFNSNLKPRIKATIDEELDVLHLTVGRFVGDDLNVEAIRACVLLETTADVR